MYKRKQINPINKISITSGNLVGDDWPMHVHSFNELVIILDGSAMQCINGEKFFVSAGDVFVIKDNDAHGFLNANSLKLFNIGYQSEVFSTYENELKKLPGYIRLFYIQPIYHKQGEFESRIHLNIKELIDVKVLIDHIEKEFESQEAGQAVMVTSYFYQLAIFLARKYSSFSLSLPRCATSLLKTTRYIESHYTEKVTLGDLANVADMPVNTFLHEFKTTFNTSPIHYIIELRIRKACELLMEKSLTITQIAVDVGFLDSNYFSRIFKERIGLSPSEYRKTFYN